jgi:hypothetical protein
LVLVPQPAAQIDKVTAAINNLSIAAPTIVLFAVMRFSHSRQLAVKKVLRKARYDKNLPARLHLQRDLIYSEPSLKKNGRHMRGVCTP